MNALPHPIEERQWPWLLLLILGTMAGALLPEAFASGFYHYDDNMHLFLPTFYEIGSQLRMGNMPWISDRSWLGGNFIGEGQFALFNPFSLALYAWMSTMPDTAMSALVFSTFHLLVLAIGAYLLVVNLGGRAAYAAAAGVACANTGIVTYWYAAAWWNALVADAWLLVAIAFWAKFLLRGRGLLPAVLFGALSMASGWPHGWIALGVFIASFAAMAYREGDRQRAAIILAGGVATLLLALPAIAPVIDYTLLSARRSRVSNTGDMVGTIEALLALSWPGYLPKTDRIYGWLAESPLTFASWFVTPVLLVCRKQLWEARRERVVLWLVAMSTVFFLLSLSPEYFYVLRWSMRFISYYQLLLIVLAAILLSRFQRDADPHATARVLAIYLALILYLGLSSEPLDPAWQIAVLFVCVLSLSLCLRHLDRGSVATPALVLVGSTLFLVAAIHYMWPRHLNVPDWRGPTEVDVAPDRYAAASTGNTIILHNWQSIRLRDKGAHMIAALEADQVTPSGSMSLWTIPRLINGYSAIPHAGMTKTLCLNIWGHTCANSLKYIFETPEGLQLRRDELLNLDEIRIKRIRFKLGAVEWPPEWRLAEQTKAALIYRRADARQRPPGSLAWVDAGLKVRADGPAQLTREALQVANAADQPQRLIFSRPSYPGFSFALDGKALPVEVVDTIFLSVSVPARASGRLVLSYAPPLLPVTATLALVGLLLATFLARRQQRPHERGSGAVTAWSQPRLMSECEARKIS